MMMDAFSRARQTQDSSGVGGLALMVMTIAAEIFESAPAAQAHGFFVTVGRRMAQLEPLDGVSDASVVAERINAFWQALNWGEIELTLGEDAIIVRHWDLPNKLTPDPQVHWAKMLLGVLEGAYDSWFRSMGSGPALQTTAAWKGDTIELRHGL